MNIQSGQNFKLTQEEVKTFFELGVFKPKGRLFSGEAFNRLLAASDEAFNKQFGEGKSGVIFNSYKIDPELAKLGLFEPMLDLVESVIGKNICMIGGPRFFMKRARSAKFVPWHSDTIEQDAAFENVDLIHVTVALTKSTKENGCVRYVVSSHKKLNYQYLKLIEHDNSLFEDKSWEIAPGQIDFSKGIVDMELQPGECSLNHVRTVHGSEGNLSGEDRFIAVFKFLAPVRSTGNDEIRQLLQQILPLRFLVRGEDQVSFCSHNLVNLKG